VIVKRRNSMGHTSLEGKQEIRHSLWQRLLASAVLAVVAMVLMASLSLSFFASGNVAHAAQIVRPGTKSCTCIYDDTTTLQSFRSTCDPFGP
jgi:hypothetical protein